MKLRLHFGMATLFLSTNCQLQKREFLSILPLGCFSFVYREHEIKSRLAMESQIEKLILASKTLPISEEFLTGDCLVLNKFSKLNFASRSNLVSVF